MQEPTKVLAPGTRVITNKLHSTKGMLITAKHLDVRASGIKGTIRGYVPGHGGDIYWVEHDDTKEVGAYGWHEFDLLE